MWMLGNMQWNVTSDSQGGGIQLFVLEGYGLLKPDSTWMDSIHFHHSTLRETFRRLSYYQHFTLKKVASSHSSPGHEPESITTPPRALKTLTPLRVYTGQVRSQQNSHAGRRTDIGVSVSFAFVKPCFLFSACTMCQEKRAAKPQSPGFRPPHMPCTLPQRHFPSSCRPRMSDSNRYDCVNKDPFSAHSGLEHFLLLETLSFLYPLASVQKINISIICFCDSSLK